MEEADQEPFRRDVNQDLWAWSIDQILLNDEEVVDWIRILEGMVGDD